MVWPVSPTTGPPQIPAWIALASFGWNSSFWTSGPLPIRWPLELTIGPLSEGGSLGILVNPRAAKFAVPAVEVPRSTVGMLLAPTLSTDTCAFPVVGYSTDAARFP